MLVPRGSIWALVGAGIALKKGPYRCQSLFRCSDAERRLHLLGFTNRVPGVLVGAPLPGEKRARDVLPIDEEVSTEFVDQACLTSSRICGNL